MVKSHVLRSALVVGLLALVAWVPPLPPPVTYGLTPVGPPVYSLQVVSASEGALFDTDEVALEFRAPRAPADTGSVRIDGSIVITWSGLGFENRDTQTAFDDAWQTYTSGMALRLKPTRRFPNTVYLMGAGASFQRYSSPLPAFDGTNDCAGASGRSWTSGYSCQVPFTRTITDPAVVARFVQGQPTDPGFVRVQMVGGIFGSDMSTWMGYDTNGVQHGFFFEGHDWETRWNCTYSAIAFQITYGP